jgi:methylenetetrahydrofolate reductase (NADH)
MRIDEIIATKDEPVFSFEFFPPKTPEGEQTLRETLQTLSSLSPDFVSVTYGAGGSTRDRTVELTGWIKQELGIEAMAHLSCVGATEERLREILDQIEEAGIENVLALRGDPPRGETDWKPTPGGLSYSTQLATLISQNYGFTVGAACFPEVHPEAESLESDLRFLKEKVQAGARFLITQLFFDNALYFNWVEQARAAGIDLPIIPGIIPITNLDQLIRFTQTIGASIPAPLLEQLEARADQTGAVAELGVAYATLQCADLLAAGAPGIHFYTLNRSPATRAILSALKLMRPWEWPEATSGRSPAPVASQPQPSAQ